MLRNHSLIVGLLSFLVLLLTSCSSSEGISDGGTKPNIVINPINFDINKTVDFTTDSVFSYISTSSTETPFVVAWNDSTSALYGDVTYNGDGTFTYAPRPNIVSGQDSFSFRVANSNGDTADGVITLDIAVGWGLRRDFYENITNYGSIASYSIAGNVIAFGPNSQLHQFDTATESWTDNLLLSGEYKVVDPNNQIVRLFHTVTVGSSTTLNYREYNPADNSFTAIVPLEQLANPNMRVYRAIIDEQSNILLMLSRSDTNYIYSAKYYDATARTWHETQDVYDSSGGVVQQTDLVLSAGKPLIYIRMPNGAVPRLYQYNTLTRLWTDTALSSETINTAAFIRVSWYRLVQNSLGDVAVFWMQTVTDPGLLTDFRHMKVSIYSAVDSALLEESTIQRFPDTHNTTLSANMLNDEDFIFMWRPYTSDSTAPDYGTGNVYAQTFNATTRSLSAQADLVVVAHSEGYLNPTPAPIMSGNGNVAFKYRTQDINNNYSHFYKVKPYRGAWSAENSLNPSPITSNVATSAFDQNNNYYSYYLDGTLKLRKYDFTLQQQSGEAQLDMTNKVFPTLVSTNTGRLFLSTSSQSIDSIGLCLTEIQTMAAFSDASLVDKGCVASNSTTISYFQIQLLESSNQTLHLVATINDGLFVSELSPGALDWSSVQFIYQNQVTADFHYYRTDLFPYDSNKLVLVGSHHAETFANYSVESFGYAAVYN